MELEGEKSQVEAPKEGAAEASHAPGFSSSAPDPAPTLPAVDPLLTATEAAPTTGEVPMEVDAAVDRKEEAGEEDLALPATLSRDAPVPSAALASAVSEPSAAPNDVSASSVSPALLFHAKFELIGGHGRSKSLLSSRRPRPAFRLR